MSGERPVVAESATEDEAPKTRYVKTSSGMVVQLDENEPDEFADAMAQAIKNGKAISGYFDEETGKFLLEELSNLR